ncbi:MAG: hypothetical protein A2X11_09280 [Bacteroidetes bacterium GWE2_42_24]|nr:MAG: hypothetical protein A2X11_09280 [Bacteroidetes bacterium GWE2_42_24]OFY31191.1 MAG: hypothetical protein A2X09_14760 [Bacteroidetes bacterium GWF2_43_11]HCT86498.1 hypothetical protein [Candidatus Margulisiibacteriota bacterium]
MDYAPILISVYTRLDHLIRCVESLKHNKIAKDSILYVVSDAAANISDEDKVNAVRLYLKSITGFKEIEILEWKMNLGSQRSIPQAINYVFENHDKLIFLEDDNFLAPNFLSFVNKGLIAYEDRSDIFSVSGYNSPFEMPLFYKNDVYLRFGFVAWGVGIWKKKWVKVDWSMKEFNSFVDNETKISKFKEIAENCTGQIQSMRKSGALLVDGVVAVHLVDKGMYSIFPVISRVRNYGLDGSGEHCGVNDIYLNQRIYEEEVDAIFPLDISPDAQLLDFIQKQYRLSWVKRIIQKLPMEFKAKVKRFILNRD